MKSLFPIDMMPTDLNIESVASKLSFFYEEINLLHWQTHSYAEHMALGSLYTYLGSFKDDVIEKIMGYTTQRPQVFKIEVLKTYSPGLCSQLVREIGDFSKNLKQYGENNGMLDVSNMADELSGQVAKTIYLLSLT